MNLQVTSPHAVSPPLRGTDPAQRARLSGGVSETRVYELLLATAESVGALRGTWLDAGCGRGLLRQILDGRVDRYIGCDLVEYEGFPCDSELVQADLNRTPYPLPDGTMDVAAAVETIEHLENPRAFMRELLRIVRPGGWVFVTTPNQLSFLSKLTLVVKNEFNAFQESARLYPAHITALLESDLRHIAEECGLEDIQIRYSNSGRIPGTCFHWPVRLGFRGRPFSDNVLLAGRRPLTNTERKL